MILRGPLLRSYHRCYSFFERSILASFWNGRNPHIQHLAHAHVISHKVHLIVDFSGSKLPFFCPNRIFAWFERLFMATGHCKNSQLVFVVVGNPNNLADEKKLCFFALIVVVGTMIGHFQGSDDFLGHL